MFFTTKECRLCGGSALFTSASVLTMEADAALAGVDEDDDDDDDDALDAEGEDVEDGELAEFVFGEGECSLCRWWDRGRERR